MKIKALYIISVILASLAPIFCHAQPDDFILPDTLIDTDSISNDTVQEINDIAIVFVKRKINHSADSVYFNVCKITNTTSRTIEGELVFRVPTGWKLIANPSREISLAAGATMNIPLRVSIPGKSVGGLAYVIDASLVTNEGHYSGAAFIKIPRVSDWDMWVNQHTLYFNEYFDDIEFDVYISNNGNASELVKLNFAIGKLLKVVELEDDEMYIDLPAYVDTVLHYTVQNQRLSEEEEHEYKMIWKESVIDIRAMVGTNKTVNESIWIRNLDNEYTHTRQEKATPLNLDVSVFNLLASVKPRINTSAFGEIQFNNEHGINYRVNGRNIFYKTGTGRSYFNNPNNLNFNIKYRWDDKLRAELGDINNYTMHIMRGWGIRSEYTIDDKNKVSGSYIQNRYYKDWSASTLYTTKIKKINTSIGGTYEDNDFIHYRAISVESGVGFSPAKNHFINARVMGTQAVFDLNQGQGTPVDSTLYGFTYMLNYNGLFNEFRIGLSTRNDQFNYIRTRPSNIIQGSVRYIINTKSRINFIGNYNTVNATRYIYNPYYEGMYSRQAQYRLTYLYRFNPKLSLETGPIARTSNRYTTDQLLGITSDFDNTFTGLFSLARIRFDEKKVLTPSASIGYTFFNDKINTDTSLAGMLTANIGINYFQGNWGINARYIFGPNFFLTETFFENEPTNFETVHLRAHISKHFMQRSVKLMAYGTYYLRMPSNLQNFVSSARMDFFMNKGWSANLTANIYTNSLDDQGIVAHRFFSMNIGVRKAFDIPQPRVKYYDLTVICFNDLNGNGEREENEPLLSNIKIEVNRDHDNDPKHIRFSESILVTDPEGQIRIVDIPEGNFNVNFEPLFNLGNLYNAHGDEQQILMSNNMTLYVPYVESYKVKGQIMLNRDPNSDKGLINIGGIRVSAETLDGKIYAALTTKEGSYVINVPQAGYYKIKVNNIFGEEFYIDKEEFLVQFDGFKSYKVDFTFYEGKRDVKFNGGEGAPVFNFGGSNTSESENIENVDE